MSGIGDSGDNSDLQRIREVNQAELRRRTEQQQRDHQTRVERSFKEVMAERGRETAAQQAQRQAPKTTSPLPGAPSTQQRLLAQVRSQGQRAHADLIQKAALSQGLAGRMVKGRAQGHRADALTAEARADEMLVQGAEELEHVRETTRQEEVRETRSADERQAEIAGEARGDGPLHRDGQRGRDHRERSGAEDGAQAEGVQSADGPPPAHQVHVPPALIHQIVGAVMKAVGPDGRTQMHLHLRGGPLDGVKLEVRAEGGQVQCIFHGCNREMKGLLDAGRSALADGLSKRGLKLTELTVA